MSDQFRPEAVTDVLERVETAAVVDRSVLEAVLAAVIARGHVLLEDVPGTGKTVTARVLAEALGLSFTRIQFTPDLLPSDVTGSNVYNEHDGTFEFSEGPVFTNVLLADEINRAPPKTQAALLEAMEERQVSADGTTHDLPEPFFVIATQNPIEQSGTFRLPEAQRDRFSVKTSLGYPDVEGEMGLLDRRANRRSLAPSVDPVTDGETVLALQELAEDVTVEEDVRRYIVDLARETRRDGRTETGVSPRGVQRVFEAARARAVIHGREFVTPEDVKRLAQPTMAHRLVLTTEATVDGVEGYDVVADALARVNVPGVAPEDEGGQPRAGGHDEAGRREPRQGSDSGQPRSGQNRQQGGPNSRQPGHAGQRSPDRRQGGAPEHGRGGRIDDGAPREGRPRGGSRDRGTPDRQQGGDPRDAGREPADRRPTQRGGDSRRRQQPGDGQHSPDPREQRHRQPNDGRRGRRPGDGQPSDSGEQWHDGQDRGHGRDGPRSDADNRRNGPDGAGGPGQDGHGRSQGDGVDRVGGGGSPGHEDHGQESSEGDTGGDAPVDEEREDT